MNTRTYIIAALALSIFFTSCEEFDNRIVPSSNITTEQHSISGYSALDVSNAFNVYVTFSNSEERIEIEANDNLHDKIEVKKDGDYLVIGLKNRVRIRGNAKMNAYITTSDVSWFEASGASNIYLENDLVSTSIGIDLSGASNFSGHVEATTMNCDLSGASNINVSGVADELELDASGASNFKGYDFETDHIDANLSGASDAKLTVNERIKIKASGASNLNYKGSASIYSQELSGASNVNKR